MEIIVTQTQHCSDDIFAQNDSVDSLVVWFFFSLEPSSRLLDLLDVLCVFIVMDTIPHSHISDVHKRVNRIQSYLLQRVSRVALAADQCYDFSYIKRLADGEFPLFDGMCEWSVREDLAICSLD